MLNKIKKISGFKGKIIFDKNKPVGQLRRVLDSTKLKKMGWNNKTKGTAFSKLGFYPNLAAMRFDK